MYEIDAKKLQSRIEARLKADLADARVDGVILRVTQHHRIVYEASFGSASPAADTLFRMASMTKPLAAAAGVLQMNRGKFDLFDPIDRFIPGYREMEIGKLNEKGEIEIIGKAQNRLRYLHVLTHTSGIGSAEVGNKEFEAMPLKPEADLAYVTDYFSRQPLAFEPYTQNAYSPLLGLDIVARTVELTSDMSFGDFVKKEFFEPLGMENTTFKPTPAQWERMIPMHNRVDGKNAVGETVPGCVFGNLPTSYQCGGAGLASTLSDYAKFAEFLLTGKIGERQVLSPANLHAFGLPHIPAWLTGPDEAWSLGMRTITGRTGQPLPVGCYGWSGAFGTHFWVDPENDITAVYLKNSFYDGGSGAVTARHFEEDVYADYQ